MTELNDSIDDVVEKLHVKTGHTGQKENGCWSQKQRTVDIKGRKLASTVCQGQTARNRDTTLENEVGRR